MSLKQKVIVGLAVLATGGLATVAMFALKHAKNRKVSNPESQEETHE